MLFIRGTILEEDREYPTGPATLGSLGLDACNNETINLQVCLDALKIWEERHGYAVNELLAIVRGEKRSQNNNTHSVFDRGPNKPMGLCTKTALEKAVAPHTKRDATLDRFQVLYDPDKTPREFEEELVEWSDREWDHNYDERIRMVQPVISQLIRALEFNEGTREGLLDSITNYVGAMSQAMTSVRQLEDQGVIRRKYHHAE